MPHAVLHSTAHTGMRRLHPALILCLTLSLLLLLSLLSPHTRADDSSDNTQRFINDAFNGAPPAPSLLILDNTLQQAITRILGHRYPGLRLRYWQDGQTTLWILNEIGKIEPITLGFVVEAGHIRALDILAYRESRGYEVEYPYFREQFYGATLTADDTLDREIDNITGATLSVNAVHRCARLVLFLHQQVMPAP